MVPDPTPGGESANGPSSDALIFVSDASAEAERLTATLRARGYLTVDVPLGLLVGRVAVQKPALVLCDVDAPGALEAVERVREVPGGNSIDVLFLGEAGRVLDEEPDRVARQSTGIFVRPVDVYSLLRKVENLIGPSSNQTARPSTLPQGSRVPVLVAATRRPYRYDTRARSRNFPAFGGPPVAAPEPTPARSEADLTPTAQALPSEPAALFPSQRPTGLSSDLTALLGRAEERVQSARMLWGGGERLSPEAELEAVLPEDLLAALDEPLDELDDEDDEDIGTPGTQGSDSNLGSRTGSRPGHDSAAGTAPGGGGNAPATREPTTAGGEKGEPAEPVNEPPPTPPAVPRSVPPVHPLVPDTSGSFPPPPPAAPPPPPTPVPRAKRKARPITRADEAPESSRQASTKPPRGHVEPSEPPPSVKMPSPGVVDVEIPNTLRVGDAVRVLARAVRARYSGAIAFEDDAGIRRVVLRDGDFVTAASGIEGESLVACLVQRGDLAVDVATRVGRKLPQFGRHAGAALIAQGHLRQDDLWPALRAHAEWIVTKIATLTRGGASLERVVPPRLSSEPSVFGGATGAEVLIEIVRRAITPSDALAWIGGPEAHLAPGEAEALLAECALSDFELELVRTAAGASVGELVERAQTQVPELPTVLFTLVELGVLRARPSAGTAGRRPRVPRAPDVIDHEAVRARIRARRALVEEGDYFALLGVNRSATSYDIRHAYTTLRREFDPAVLLTPLTADLTEDVALVLEMLDEAYDILRDTVRRERYRRALEDSPD